MKGERRGDVSSDFMLIMKVSFSQVKYYLGVYSLKSGYGNNTSKRSQGGSLTVSMVEGSGMSSFFYKLCVNVNVCV